MSQTTYNIVKYIIKYWMVHVMLHALQATRERDHVWFYIQLVNTDEIESKRKKEWEDEGVLSDFVFGVTF